MSQRGWRKPTGVGVAAMAAWAIILLFLPGRLNDEIEGWWRAWAVAPKALMLLALAWYSWSRGALVVLFIAQGCLLATYFLLNAAWEHIYEDAIVPGLALMFLPFVDVALMGAAVVVIQLGLDIANKRTGPLTHCTRCGYDLAGLKGGVCPECGLWVRLMKR